MSEKDKAIDRDDAKKWEAKWAEAANTRLQNSAKGEWSPWQAMKMAALSIPLKANEAGAYGGWSESVPRETTDREAAYETAMKSADRQAEARAQVQAAMESGNESPQSMAKGKAFLSQAAELPVEWQQRYPQYAPKKVVGSR